MVVIHHTGYSVEAEAVNLVFLYVPRQIREQVSKYLVFRIIEYHGVPSRVVAFLPGMRVAVIRAVKPVYAIIYIVGGVRVNYVNNYEQAHSMRFVH